MVKLPINLYVSAFLMLALTACSEPNPFTESTFENTTYSLDQFKYQDDRVDVGSVYTFDISNSDRTYVKKVSLYVAAKDKIEAFKIYPGSSSTYLVSAEIDWNLFSIKHIQQTQIEEDLTRNKTIEMSLVSSPDNHYLFNAEDKIPTGHFPVFNHGYDFSDLNFVFRHLSEPMTTVEVGILAPVGSKMAYTGRMTIKYESEETYQSRPVYKYSLGGDGISGREGFLLVNKELGHFEYMEMNANYHPNMDFFRYELLSVKSMSNEEWETFITEETESYFRTNR